VVVEDLKVNTSCHIVSFFRCRIFAGSRINSVGVDARADVLGHVSQSEIPLKCQLLRNQWI
jgi:hypothetical protein